MRQNVSLRCRLTPQRVPLPNGRTFRASYERVSPKNLPGKVTIRRTRTIGPRNRVVRKKKVRFAPSATQKVARRIVNKYKKQRRKKHKQEAA